MNTSDHILKLAPVLSRWELTFDYRGEKETRTYIKVRDSRTGSFFKRIEGGKPTGRETLLYSDLITYLKKVG